MDISQLGPDAVSALDDIAGYLNLSTGRADPQFERRVNELYRELEQTEGVSEPWQSFRALIDRRLGDLQRTSSAFADIEQARAVLGLTFDGLLPAYREHHRDLLRHQPDGVLFRPFFLAKVLEAILTQGAPWYDNQRIVTAALAQLNDYVGYRPVAVLEDRQKLEIYPHERVRPIPLYLRGAGVACGRYEPVIKRALEILDNTDSELLDAAYFDPALLDELALDPRAYDFDHPVNKRPNYHFGLWDPHLLDAQGRYRRFVLTQVTLDALCERVEHSDGTIPQEELLYEAGAVLAGVMLMASAVCGRGPDTHSSEVTLGSLMPVIAHNRDRYYRALMNSVPDAHQRRLKAELSALHQPFAGARQHLNHALARRRAEQLQHMHLAHLYARMGQREASRRQLAIVPVTSARMSCEIDCEIATAVRALESGELDSTRQSLVRIRDLLRRAVECGAVVDPWNILGFGGRFSLFPAIENSVHDHRVDELIGLVERTFELYGRTLAEAAAAGASQIVSNVSDEMESLAGWWDQFATIEVGDIESFSGLEAWESAVHVAHALRAWHRAGAAAGDIGFWKQHVEQFESPKAFALAVAALLEKQDTVAAMGLLMQWLSQSTEVALAEGPFSFFELALRWEREAQTAPKQDPASAAESPDRAVQRFFDFLEANAGEYWSVPAFELGDEDLEIDEDLVAELYEMEEGEPDEDDIYDAAYEGVTYRDSTDDNQDSELFDVAFEFDTDYELDYESARISDRLLFLTTVARLWKVAAVRSSTARTPATDDDRLAVWQAWLEQAHANTAGLMQLLMTLEHYQIDPPSGAHQAMVEFDRRRLVKEALLDTTIAALVETSDAVRTLLVVCSPDSGEGRHAGSIWSELAAWQRQCVALLAAMLRGDAEGARSLFPGVLSALESRTVLYVPIGRGGQGRRVVAAQNLLHLLRQLLRGLPQLGLITETCQLLATIPQMEKSHPAGAGAVTEYDRLFATGYRAIVSTLLKAADRAAREPSRAASADAELVDALHRITGQLIQQWLHHGRSLRLGVLEPLIDDEDAWRSLVSFTERYGADLFTQQFLHLGNVRSILHQGVDAYLTALAADDSPGPRIRLLADLDRTLSRETAVAHLETILEAIVENFAEYRDYNQTTTQSDHGDMLYVLLDFLRVKASHRRVAWNMRPLVLAHELLVRAGREEAATLWRQAIAERTEDIAQQHQRNLKQLERRHGATVPTVSDLVRAQFVRPLRVDRVAALIERALRAANPDQTTHVVEALEREVAEFTAKPSGAGLDVPDWLLALEAELDRVEHGARRPWVAEDAPLFPDVQPDWQSLVVQIDAPEPE